MFIKSNVKVSRCYLDENFDDRDPTGRPEGLTDLTAGPGDINLKWAFNPLVFQIEDQSTFGREEDILM
jgi:hypothetical protein